MNNSLDILLLDKKIKKIISQKNNIDICKKNLLYIDKLLKNDTLNNRIRNELLLNKENLEKYIQDVKIDKQYNFYLIETFNIISEYKKMLNTTISVNFFGKKKKINNSQKQLLIDKFLCIAEKYVDINIEPEKNSQMKCPSCNNTKNFDIINNNTYICTECYGENHIVKYISYYNDIDRISINNKYEYDPRNNFRESIIQYQGKQNKRIPKTLLDDLSTQFKRHHLLKDSKINRIKYQNITKKHIYMFLKELNYSNYYDDIHLIHTIFTEIPADNISHLENILMEDFNILFKLYQKMFKQKYSRKNFINTQYVLYQLLRRHKHKCNEYDFSCLKTIDIKNFHDDVCKRLFEELGWNHTAYY